MTTIETARLLLRPLTPRDLDSLVVAINDFQIIRNTARIPFPYGRTDAEDYFALTQRAEPSQLFLSIVLRSDPARIVGGISAEGGPRDSELGYWITRPMWGNGYASEAALAMVSHVFQFTEYTEMVAGYRIGNTASRRILEKLGFTPAHEDMIESRGLGYLVPVMRMTLSRLAWNRAGGELR